MVLLVLCLHGGLHKLCSVAEFLVECLGSKLLYMYASGVVSEHF